LHIVTLLPVIVLGVITATLIASLVHVVRGRTMRDFVSIWLVAQAGFWLGHGIAVVFNAPLYTIGDLQIVAGFLGTILALGIAIVRHR
jgi:hypothetical protein